MIESNSDYKSAFKATGIFGGVQIITILINILKSKLIAIWLGSVGFGIMSLFNSTIGLISVVSNLGLQQSAVREIAISKSDENQLAFAKVIKSIGWWVGVTGVVGMLIMIGFSSVLSKVQFGDNKFTLSFIFLSPVILLMGFYNYHYAILQGTREIRKMAQATILGVALSFVITIPVLYLFRRDGIVICLILTAFITVLISYFYVKKMLLSCAELTNRDSFLIGLKTVKLGMAMAVSSVFVYIVEFIVKLVISRYGGIADVGLYQAGWALNAQYLGLVFTAMAKDYFPRLSQISNDDIKVNKSVNEQGEISILLLGPMILFVLTFVSYIIKLLYSAEFIDIIPMTRWLLVGSIVKAGSWAISFVFLAKGDGKIFLFNEIGIKFVTLPSYVLGYQYWGLLGIGYAYSFCYLLYFIWVAIIANKKYKVLYNRRYWKLFSLCFFFSIFSILVTLECSTTIAMIINIQLFVILTIISLKELNRKTGLISVFNKYHKK